MTTVLWLMRDFRFTDNEALRLAAAAGPVLPVFLLDSIVAQMGAAPRLRLERALRAFDSAWQKRSGQRITVMRGEAASVLPALAREVGARQIVQNDWPWAPVHQAQDRLEAELAGSGISFQRAGGHLLIPPARLLAGRASAYKVWSPFARRLSELGPDLPVPPVGQITALPAKGSLDEMPPLAPDLFGGAEVLMRHGLPVGEEAAHARFEAFLAALPGYAAARDIPAAAAGSGLSEALATGEISARWLWARIRATQREQPGLAGDLQKFLSELIWRDFAWHLLLDFPAMAERPWRAGWDGFPWLGETPAAAAWRRAATGVPLVDAGLREMRITGRMENRVRMIVAGLLTKQLQTDWRIGLSHFADSLTDWDPASNAMNWQWVAGCGPDAAPYFRIFNPLRQAAQFDPDGRYQHFWLKDPAMQAAWQAATPRTWHSAAPPRPLTQGDLMDLRGKALSLLQHHRDAGAAQDHAATHRSNQHP